MGSFVVHVMTGIYTTWMSLWWMYNAACRCIASRKLNTPFHSSCWYLWNRYPNFPVEGWFTLVIGILEVCSEIFTGWDDLQEGFYWTNGQHMVMFSFLALYGAIQLLQFYRLWVVPGTDYLVLILTLCMSGFLLTQHTHGHVPVDVLIHKFVLYPTAGMIFTTLLQYFRSDLPMIAMARSIFGIHFGLNWLHAGLILFPPWGVTWDLNSHTSSLQVTVLFGAELVISCLTVIFMNSFVSKLYENDVTSLKKAAQLQHFEIPHAKQTYTSSGCMEEGCCNRNSVIVEKNCA